MSRKAKVALVALIGFAGSYTVYAQPVPEGIHRQNSGETSICELRGPNVAAIRSQLLEMRGVTPLTMAEGSYIAYSQEQPRRRVWTFTTDGNAAHPAVVCRTVEEVDGEVQLRMEISCEASRQECDNLYRQFEALNQRTLRPRQ